MIGGAKRFVGRAKAEGAVKGNERVFDPASAVDTDHQCL